jgi:hypothetical protein
MRYLKGDESKDVIDYLNSTTSTLYQSRYIYCMEQCKTKGSAQIFHDWWHGICISSDEYQRHVNEEDYLDAHDWIMETISIGMG